MTKQTALSNLQAKLQNKLVQMKSKAKRAGLLSKCDLMTNMVFEFTDTQGVMGMHYARHDGEDEEVDSGIK